MNDQHNGPEELLKQQVYEFLVQWRAAPGTLPPEQAFLVHMAGQSRGLSPEKRDTWAKRHLSAYQEVAAQFPDLARPERKRD